MAESDGEERTEDPTGKRLREAQEKGQIPRSRELNSFVMLIAAGGMVIMTGSEMMQGLVAQFHHGLTLSRGDIFDPHQLIIHFRDAAEHALTVMAPFLAVMTVAAILSSIALGGISFSSEALTPKLDKLNPVTGIGRLFSWRSLLEMGKSLAKFLLVGTVMVVYLRHKVGAFMSLASEPVYQGLAHTGSLIVWSFFIISFSLLLLVLVDVPFQLWDHKRQLKMTKQEVKEEHKETEGSPEVKGRQRRIQREMAQRRMMEQVPQADVVVTNPTHYAVALRYDQESMDAPVLVAKGADEMAMRIRNVASEHNVPILSAPPLTRALYHSTELDQPIPFGLYRAVAQVLAYVFHLNQGAVYEQAGESPLDDLPIPEELRRDD